jgi:hypothetical protein
MLILNDHSIRQKLFNEISLFKKNPKLLKAVREEIAGITEHTLLQALVARLNVWLANVCCGFGTRILLFSEFGEINNLKFLN